MEFSFFIALLTLSVFSINLVNADALDYVEEYSKYSSIPFEEYEKYVECYKRAFDLYERYGKVDIHHPDMICAQNFFKKNPQLTKGDSIVRMISYSSENFSKDNIEFLKSVAHLQHLVLPYKISLQQLFMIESPMLAEKEKMSYLEPYLKGVPARIRTALKAIILVEKPSREDFYIYDYWRKQAFVGASKDDIAAFKSKLQRDEVEYKSKRDSDQLKYKKYFEESEREKNAPKLFRNQKNNAAFVCASSFWFVALMMSLLLL